MFLDIEFENIIRSNLDSKLIETKLDWWKLTCSESIDGKYFSVPSLRLVNKYFLNNNIIKKNILLLIDILKSYYFENKFNNKIKIYSKYLLARNNLICNICNIKNFDTDVQRSLNF